jgi:protein-S-isoprenylcysteine O-methyltransferase Ste14
MLRHMGWWRAIRIETVVDYGERLFLVLLTLPFLAGFASYALSEPGAVAHPYAIALVTNETLGVILIVIRRRGEISARAYPLALAFAGTALPLLARPGGVPLIPGAVASAVAIAGLVISIWSKLALNRSFGLVAANRGIKRGGPYRFVRHPMYLSYIIIELSFLLSSFGWGLLLIYLVTWTVQVLRIVEEEKQLSRDPLYRAHQAQVRARLVPGVF